MKCKVIGHDGPLCHRCGQATEVREHAAITDKELRRPFYYLRWYNCTNPDCATTLIMPPDFRSFAMRRPARDLSAHRERPGSPVA